VNELHDPKLDSWTTLKPMPSKKGHITVSTTNQIFHSGRDDQKMTSGSKLINMKEMILVFIIFYQ
jgi:hypothetical protein